MTQYADYIRDMVWDAYEKSLSTWFDSLSLKEKFSFIRNGFEDTPEDRIYEQEAWKELCAETDKNAERCLAALVQTPWLMAMVKADHGGEYVEIVSPDSPRSPEARAGCVVDALFNVEWCDILDSALRNLDLDRRFVNSDELDELFKAKDKTEP